MNAATPSLASTTAIEDLPTEILTQILGLDSIKDDLQTIQKVCQLWYKVVDETIGREVLILSMKPKPLRCPRSPFKSTICSDFSILRKHGVKTCFLDLPEDDEQGEEGESSNQDKKSDDVIHDENAIPIPAFKFPHLLRNIFVNGSITSKIFRVLLTDTFNVTVLELNLFALHNLRAEDLHQLCLPNLKVLGVRRCMKSICRGFDDRLGLPNLQELLGRNVFPALVQLDVRFPVKDYDDFSTLCSLLTFFTRHLHLKELYLLMDFPIFVDGAVRTYPEDMDKATQLIKKISKMELSLNVVEIQAIRLHGSYPQLDLWKKFLLQQSNLKSVTLRLGSLTTETLQCICMKSCTTLESMYLYKLNENHGDGIRVNANVTLDCSVFRCMKKLKTLYALGCDLILEANKLPTSLHTLFLTGSIKTEEVQHVLLHLPNLVFVSFRNACNKRTGHGVSIDILRQFKNQRRVKRLILNGSSLSEAYPLHGIPNGDPRAPQMLKEFDNWDPDQTYVDWELNSDAYYINKYY